MGQQRWKRTWNGTAARQGVQRSEELTRAHGCQRFGSLLIGTGQVMLAVSTSRKNDTRIPDNILQYNSTT